MNKEWQRVQEFINQSDYVFNLSDYYTLDDEEFESIYNFTLNDAHQILQDFTDNHEYPSHDYEDDE